MPYKSKEDANAHKRKYYSTPKWKEYMREYRRKNKEKIAKQNLETQKRLRETNPSYQIACLSRSRLNYGLKRIVQQGKEFCFKPLGCTFVEFKQHLEDEFADGMSWDNYGHGGWTIDHIVPLCKFDLTNEIELNKAMHFSNTQPMWERDNHRKKKNYYDNEKENE